MVALEQKLQDKTADFAHLEADLAFCKMELDKSRRKLAQLTSDLKNKKEEADAIQAEMTSKLDVFDNVKTRVAELTEALGEKTLQLEEQESKHNEASR